MVRKIIKIDREKCDGCGQCAVACHEGAIAMIDGKAHLTREDYCDGLGDCLPACPTGAITFEIREAAEYNEEAVVQAKIKNGLLHFACPSVTAKSIENTDKQIQSQLKQWPVQIKLLPAKADFYENAELLIAADCSAFSFGDFHNKFMKGRITIIGCPKLDAVDYTENLAAIIGQNNIRSVTVVRMEVPCCGGLEYAARNALMNSGKILPWTVITLTTDGKVKN